MSHLFAGEIASGVELMGMPMPTLIQSTFKTIESGYHNCMFWELIPNTNYFGITFTSSSLHNREMYTPLYPFLYSKTGVYRGIQFFLFLIQNIHCGYPIEPPRQGGSNVYPQCVFWANLRK